MNWPNFADMNDQTLFWYLMALAQLCFTGMVLCALRLRVLSRKSSSKGVSMLKQFVRSIFLLLFCAVVLEAQQVTIQPPLNYAPPRDPSKTMLFFSPSSNQSGSQTAWRNANGDMVFSIGPFGVPTFNNGTQFVQTTGWGLNILPSARPTGSQVYLFGLNDGGGQTSGLMSANGAALKTYAFGILVNRPSTAAVTGDSNDAIAKWSYNNYGANDSNFILRGLNTVVNNRSGGTLGQLTGGLISASSKSGSTSPYVKGLEVNVENFGTNATEHGGLDVTLKNEGAKATSEYGVRVRNLNNSIAGPSDAVILVTEPSLVNTGWNYIVDSDGVKSPAGKFARLQSGAEIISATGVPAGGLCTAANLGSIYLNHGGGGGTTLYVCEVAGAWAAK